jgi:hypothetical protein
MDDKEKSITRQCMICTKEKEISEIQTLLKTIVPVVMGKNGKDGLIVLVPVLSERVEDLTIASNTVSSSVRELLEYHKSEAAKKEQKQQDQMRYEQKRILEMTKEKTEYDKRMKKKTLVISIIAVLVAGLGILSGILIN